MAYILVIIFLFLLSWFGHKVRKLVVNTDLSSEAFANLPGFGKIAIDLVIGISIFILAAHVLAFATNSFVYASYIVTALILIYFLLDIAKLKSYFDEIQSSNFNWLVLAYALILGFIAAYKNLYVGDSAKFHFTIIGSIANNHIYPPIAAFDSSQSLSGYHYGVVLLSALFKILCSLDPFQASAVQLGLQVTVFTLLVFTTINIFAKSHTWSFFLTLVLIHFFSFDSQNPLITLIFSRSQSLSFSWFLTIFIMLLILKKDILKTKRLKLFLILSPLSFFLYFAFPAAWYPMFVGVAAGLGLEALFKRQFDSKTILGIASVLISIGIGKFLTLMKSFTSLNGVEALVFKPGLRWFDMLSASTQSYKPYITSIQLDQMATIPLWSWYSLKTFLLLFFVASIIFLLDSFKFQKWNRSILYFAASVSMLVPFLFVFEPYPKDTQRFLFYAKIMFLLYLIFFLAEYGFKKLPKQSYFVAAISLLFFVQIVFIKPEFFRTYAVPESQRAMIKELEAIHKSGDVMIDTEFLHINSFYPNIAGFYGIGGHFYSADMISRTTAIHLLNPLLLQELGVDYVLINAEAKVIRNKVKQVTITPKNSLAKRVIYGRIGDATLFQRIPINSSPNSILLNFVGKDKKFTAEEIAKYQEEYKWAMGYRNIFNFTPVQNKDGQWITAQTRKDLEPYYHKVQNEIAKHDVISAVSLSMGVVTSVGK